MGVVNIEISTECPWNGYVVFCFNFVRWMENDTGRLPNLKEVESSGLSSWPRCRLICCVCLAQECLTKSSILNEVGGPSLQGERGGVPPVCVVACRIILSTLENMHPNCVERWSSPLASVHCLRVNKQTLNTPITSPDLWILANILLRMLDVAEFPNFYPV